MNDSLRDEIVRYLTSTFECWWTARRIGTVLPHAEEHIDAVIESCWKSGQLRRKRGVGGLYEYQARAAQIS